MNLAIFGATGRTGQHLLRRALEAGHAVIALARDPGKLAVNNERLRVVQGSLREVDCIDQVVRGADAVLSVLGPSSNQPVFEISQGTAAIIAAMKKHGVKRLVISAGAGVGDPGDAPGLLDRVMGLLLGVMAKNVYADMLKAVALVRDSGLDWTVVRAPMLTDDPGGGQVRAGMLGRGVGPRLSRADLARFMLAQVESEQYVGKAPVISN